MIKILVTANYVSPESIFNNINAKDDYVITPQQYEFMLHTHRMRHIQDNSITFERMSVVILNTNSQITILFLKSVTRTSECMMKLMRNCTL